MSGVLELVDDACVDVTALRLAVGAVGSADLDASSQSSPSHFIASTTWEKLSSESRAASVSSMRKTKVPPVCLA